MVRPSVLVARLIRDLQTEYEQKKRQRLIQRLRMRNKLSQVEENVEVPLKGVLCT